MQQQMSQVACLRDHKPMPLHGTAGSSRAFSAHRNDKSLEMGE